MIEVREEIRGEIGMYLKAMGRDKKLGKLPKIRIFRYRNIRISQYRDFTIFNI